MFLQGSWVDLQGQLRQSFIAFRVYVKLILDPWIDHLQDHPMGRNPTTLVHILGGCTLTKWGGHPTCIKKVTELARCSSERSS
jgi:hypothetical protein